MTAPVHTVPYDSDLDGLRDARPLNVPQWPGMWSYLMGGKDNYQVDRDALHKVIEKDPTVFTLGLARLDIRAVLTEHVAAKNVDQFLVAGADYPRDPEVHHLADRARPGAKVMYADQDHLVLLHMKALHRCRIAEAAPGDPDELVAVAERHFDWTRPIGFFWFNTLEDLDDAMAALTLRAIAAAAPAGSVIALSHLSEESKPEVETLATETEAAGAAKLHLRSPDQIREMLVGAGLDVGPLGVAPAAELAGRSAGLQWAPRRPGRLQAVNRRPAPTNPWVSALWCAAASKPS